MLKTTFKILFLIAISTTATFLRASEHPCTYKIEVPVGQSDVRHTEIVTIFSEKPLCFKSVSRRPDRSFERTYCVEKYNSDPLLNDVYLTTPDCAAAMPLKDFLFSLPSSSALPAVNQANMLTDPDMQALAYNHVHVNRSAQKTVSKVCILEATEGSTDTTKPLLISATVCEEEEKCSFFSFEEFFNPRIHNRLKLVAWITGKAAIDDAFPHIAGLAEAAAESRERFHAQGSRLGAPEERVSEKRFGIQSTWPEYFSTWPHSPGEPIEKSPSLGTFIPKADMEGFFDVFLERVGTPVHDRIKLSSIFNEDGLSTWGHEYNSALLERPDVRNCIEKAQEAGKEVVAILAVLDQGEEIFLMVTPEGFCFLKEDLCPEKLVEAGCLRVKAWRIVTKDTTDTFAKF